ncbi:DUF2953 domain-containing protein [Butyrivibrio sp. MC2013]|uniref:DUF2953 domain-containing protein n=1 Tax=Butyrivibrio sp. MC2013 TaxID=1280686 RepID=UPI0003F61C08|nr:DUF2953 domain-containing protein [Butyrivibrio sp. MC2013]
MPAILFGIIKWTGIVVGIILLLLLVLILLILFVPVRYEIRAVLPPDGEGDILTRFGATAKVSWLLKIVRGRLLFENKEVSLWAKALFFTILPRESREETKAEQMTDAEREKVSAAIDESEEKDNLISPKADTATEIDMHLDLDDTHTDSVSYNEPDDQEEKAPKAAKPSRALKWKIPDPVSIIWNILDKIFSFIDMIFKAVDALWTLLNDTDALASKIEYTLEKGCVRIEMIRRLIESPEFERGFGLGKKGIYKVLKDIMPCKITGEVTYGMGDPADTANLLAIAGPILAYTDNRLDIYPDFDRKYLDLDIDIKGRIRIFVLLYWGAVLFFNKDIREVIRRFKKIFA